MLQDVCVKVKILEDREYSEKKASGACSCLWLKLLTEINMKNLNTVLSMGFRIWLYPRLSAKPTHLYKKKLCIGYDTKLYLEERHNTSYGECGVLPCQLLVIVPVRVPSIGQIDQLENYLY